MSNINPEDHNEWLLAIQNVHPIVAPQVIEIPKPHVVKKPVDRVFTHDLHGRTVDDAFNYVVGIIPEAYDYDIGELRIITGKSGSIFREFHQWMNTPFFRQYVRGVTLESNGGSYIIFLLSK